MSHRPAILWFRDDLRTYDHPAFYQAAQTGQPLLCVFIMETAPPLPPLGGAAHWWLHGALASLRETLEKAGGHLLTLHGASEALLPALARDINATAIYTHARFHQHERAQEERIAKALPSEIILHKSWGSVLLDPERVKNKTGKIYRVFTPFWKALQQHTIATPLPEPKNPHFLSFKHDLYAEHRLDESQLLPQRPDWASGLRDTWEPTLRAAGEHLRDFVRHDLSNYETSRNLMGENGTSHLAPYLASGQISPRVVWHVVRRHGRSASDVHCFLSEIAWREFARYTLYHLEALPFHNLNPKFNHLPWQNNPATLKAWQTGRTGIPIVDAGMRELWETGSMHNRARMIVGSFLTRHLLTHWSKGEEWFRDTLVDADNASNSMNWQWVAGTGIDATPYFRIFNPTLQAEKFDPHGDYITRWVPELRGLSGKDVREPWNASPMLLSSVGIQLGHTYPYPIVELKKGRDAALSALKKTQTDTPS